MDIKMGFELNLIVVEAIRGRYVSVTVLKGNGFGYIWWTDDPIYFSSIDDSIAYLMASCPGGASTYPAHGVG